MEEKYTINEFLIAIIKVFNYLGSDKVSQIIKSGNLPSETPIEKTPDDLLEEINNYTEQSDG